MFRFGSNKQDKRYHDDTESHRHAFRQMSAIIDKNSRDIEKLNEQNLNMIDDFKPKDGQSAF